MKRTETILKLLVAANSKTLKSAGIKLAADHATFYQNIIFKTRTNLKITFA